MKQYYYDQMQKSILKYEIASIGYTSKMKELATLLINDDELFHGDTIKKINALREVFDEVIAEVESYKAKYHEECDKEVAQDESIRK
jgi:hypothetical protein